MDTEQVKALYARSFTINGVIRRYTGSPGVRTPHDVPCRLTGEGQSSAVLAGSVTEQGYEILALREDLVTGGFSLPITTADKLVMNGRELAILSVDLATRAINDTVIADRLRVKG